MRCRRRHRRSRCCGRRRRFLPRIQAVEFIGGIIRWIRTHFRTIQIGAVQRFATGVFTETARRAHSVDDGVDSIPIFLRVSEAFEHESAGSFADCGGGVLTAIRGTCRAWIAIVVNCVLSDHRRRSPARSTAPTSATFNSLRCTRAHGEFERAEAGTFLAGHGEAWSADAKCPRDPAGDDAAEGSHGAIRIEGRARCVAEGCDPGVEFLFAEYQIE